jgi:hypothetical protein
MNSLLSVRLGHASCGLALAIIGTAAACSSSSAGPVSGGPDGGSTGTSGDGSTAASGDGSTATSGDGSTSGDGGSGGNFNGTGAPCPMLTEQWVGALLTLDVSWLPVIAAAQGTGKIYIWSLYHYMFNGTAITGTSRTCGDQLPPLALNATGKMAINAPASATTVEVLNQTPTKKTWDNDTRTAATSGTLGGWNVGSSLAMNVTTSVSGLAPTSTYANPTTAWPAASLTFAASDLSDDDKDGNPGITAYPLADNSAGYYLPATSLGGTSGNGSMPTLLADKLYIVSRTQVSLYGTSSSCTETTGTVTAPEYVVHVVGCHDQGTAATASCMPNEWQFIDENATIYAGAGGPKATITGTFDAKQLASADGGEPSCDDVVALFPSPMPTPQGDQ